MQFSLNFYHYLQDHLQYWRPKSSQRLIRIRPIGYGLHCCARHHDLESEDECLHLLGDFLNVCLFHGFLYHCLNEYALKLREVDCHDAVDVDSIRYGSKARLLS